MGIDPANQRRTSPGQTVLRTVREGRLAARRLRVAARSELRRLLHAGRPVAVLDQQLPDDGMPAWRLSRMSEHRRAEFRARVLGRASALLTVVVLTTVTITATGQWAAQVDLELRRGVVEAQAAMERVGSEQPLDQPGLAHAAEQIRGAGAAGRLAWVATPWSDDCLQLWARDGQVSTRPGRLHHRVCMAETGR